MLCGKCLLFLLCYHGGPELSSLGAFLVQALLLLSQRMFPKNQPLLFLYLSPSLTNKVHMDRQVVGDSGVSWRMPEGNLGGGGGGGTCLFKMGPFFAFAFNTRRRCFVYPTQMDFFPLFPPLHLSSRYVHNLFLLMEKKLNSTSSKCRQCRIRKIIVIFLLQGPSVLPLNELTLS